MPAEKDDIECLAPVLLSVRQKLEEVLRVVPNLDINDLSELPPGKAEAVRGRLWLVYVYAEFPIRWMMEESRGQIVKVKGTGAFRFYDDVYVPHRGKIQELLLGKTRFNTDEVFEKIREVNEGYINVFVLMRWVRDGSIREIITNCKKQLEFSAKIDWKETFLGSLDYKAADIVDSDASPLDDIESYITVACESWRGPTNRKAESKAWEVMCAPYFQPNDWHTNFKEVEPIFTTQNMPTRIESRIQEIHFSYTFGNWMAVAALCRSLLEFMILDRKLALGLKKERLYKKEGNEKTKYLRPLGEIVSRIRSTNISADTKKDMKYIIKCGNRVMHWPKSNVVDFAKQEEVAQTCLSKIRKIISVLYAPPPRKR